MHATSQPGEITHVNTEKNQPNEPQAQTQNNQQLPTGDETIRAMKAAQAEAKRELKGIDKQLTALGTAIETLGGEVRELEGKQTELGTSIDQLTQDIANTESRDNDIASLKELDSKITAKKSALAEQGVTVVSKDKIKELTTKIAQTFADSDFDDSEIDDFEIELEIDFEGKELNKDKATKLKEALEEIVELESTRDQLLENLKNDGDIRKAAQDRTSKNLEFTAKNDAYKQAQDRLHELTTELSQAKSESELANQSLTKVSENLKTAVDQQKKLAADLKLFTEYKSKYESNKEWETKSNFKSIIKLKLGRALLV